MKVWNFKRDFLETAKCDLSTFAKRCFKYKVWKVSELELGETGYERTTGMVVTVNFSSYVVNARPRDYLSTFLVCSRIFHQFFEATGSQTKILWKKIGFSGTKVTF